MDKRDKAAAQRALEATNTGSNDYMKLSGQMCWAAVGFLAVPDIINQKRFNELFPPPNGGNYDVVGPALIPKGNANTVKDAKELTALEPGEVLGFYEGDRLTHAMLYTGEGCATGNKNGCIGIGNPIGWEKLNLAMNWDKIKKKLEIHHRALHCLK